MFFCHKTEPEFGILLETVERLLTQRLDLGPELAVVRGPVEEPITKRLESSEELSMDMEADDEVPGDELMRTSSETHESSGRERRLITFFIWVVKALALRGFPDLHKWIDKVSLRLLKPLFDLFYVRYDFTAQRTDTFIKSKLNVFFLLRT